MSRRGRVCVACGRRPAANGEHRQARGTPSGRQGAWRGSGKTLELSLVGSLTCARLAGPSSPNFWRALVWGTTCWRSMGAFACLFTASYKLFPSSGVLRSHVTSCRIAFAPCAADFFSPVARANACAESSAASLGSSVAPGIGS